MDHTILNRITTGWIAVETVCLFLVSKVYRRVYLGIRNRKLNEISQIGVLIKEKLTGLLTAAGVYSRLSPFLFLLFRKRCARLSYKCHSPIYTEIWADLLLYCYRDRPPRNARAVVACACACAPPKVARNILPIWVCNLMLANDSQACRESKRQVLGDFKIPSPWYMWQILYGLNLQRPLSTVETSSTAHVKVGA